VATFISVAALIIVLSVMNGFNRNIENKLLAVEPHVAIDNLTAEQVTYVRDRFGSRAEGVLQVFEQDLLIRTVDGLFSGGVARGFSAGDLQAFLSRVLRLKHEVNELPFDLELGPNEILMGAELARSLNIYQGDQVTLIPPESLLLPSGEIPFLERARVRALLQTDVPGFDTKMIVYNRDISLLRLAKTETLKNVTELRLADPGSHHWIAGEIRQEMKLEPHRISTWASRNSSLFFALKLERLAMMSLLGLSVIVTSFSIIMVLLIFIAEKQKDIGLFMALGMSGQRTRLLFGQIGLFLALTGSLAGFVFGTIASLLIEKYPLHFMPEVYVDTTLPSQVIWSDLLVALVGILVLSLIACSWPVVRAMRLTPTEALKGFTAFRRLR
jgi:lipoprotein-releasing system permease protein